ncbi:MAG: M50 family metallopeptidase [Lentimicrobiaceae bacterium]|jgi:hypothetical protein|nr:M50 family metallopeptidase [Lentimicrobiaceae bacterium]
MQNVNRDTVFYILLVISLILTRVPIVGIYFRVVNTMIHETGHALMALFSSGSVLRVEYFSNTEGNALTKSSGRLGSILVSLAGYPFSSAMGLLFFYLIHSGWEVVVLYVVAGLAFINLFFFVRNRYGIFWLITFLLVTGSVLYFQQEFLLFAFPVFIAMIVMVDSLLSAVHLLLISLHTPKKAGDAKNLKKFTGIPAFVWALLFMAFASYTVYLSVSLFFNLNLFIQK